MKTKPSKLEQALRDSPSDVFEVRASNGVEVTLWVDKEWVQLRTPSGEGACLAQDTNPGFRWVLRRFDSHSSFAPHTFLVLSETLHAIAEVLEMLNGDREWGEECSETQ